MTAFSNDVEAYLVMYEGYDRDYVRNTIIKCKHVFEPKNALLCTMQHRQQVTKNKALVCKYCGVRSIMRNVI